MDTKLFHKVLSCAAIAAAAMLTIPSSKAFAAITTEVGQTKMVVTAEIAEPFYKEYGDTVFLYRIYGTGTENKGQEKYCSVTIPAGETTGSTVVPDLDYMIVKYSSTDSKDDVDAAKNDAKAKYKWSIGRIPASTRYSLVNQSSAAVSSSATVSILPEKTDVSTKANPYEQNGVYIYAADGDGKAIAGKSFQIKNSAGQYVTATKQDDGTYLYSGLSATAQTYQTDKAGRVTIYKDTQAHAMPADTYTIYAVDVSGNVIAKTEASREAKTAASMISYSAVFDSIKSGYKVTTSTYMVANYKYLTRDYERTSHSVLKVNHIGGTTGAPTTQTDRSTYTVTFDAGNGVFADNSSSKTVRYNRNKTTGEWSVQSGSYEEPTYAEHTFGGWSESSDAASVGFGMTEADVETYLNNKVTEHTGSDNWSGTIYAQWSK